MARTAKNDVGSQREQAYQGLRRLLILHQIEPGQRLREPEWATRLNVHRSALREAFARLEAEGWVERGTATGYFVPRLKARDFAEIIKLRLALECLAIDELCACDNPPLEPVARACDELSQFVEGGYSLGAAEADRRFHETLIDAAGMRRLSALYHRAALPLIHQRTEDKSIWHDECARTLDEHRQILQAIVQHNPEKAKQKLREHLNHRSLLPMCR